jgi:hypothetical protein
LRQISGTGWNKTEGLRLEISLEIAHFLVSPEGRTALSELAGIKEAEQLSVLTRLRRKWPPEIAGALVEQALLRQRAARLGKFPFPESMFFTSAALEQASGQAVAQYRTSRIAAIIGNGARVLEMGGGIGGDTLALASLFRVTALEQDATRLIFAEANLKACNLQAELKNADIAGFEVEGFAAIFFDPARRSGTGRRIFSVEDYSPPLSTVRRWLEKVPGVAVKISPGVSYDELTGYDCEVEIISERGEVKEAVLWFGNLKSAYRRATLLPGPHTLVYRPDKPEIPSGIPLQFLYEPDGAVIRAGLVEELALLMGGATRKIDPDIAFLTSEDEIDPPFARRFRILESLPWNLKHLNRRLQELEIGQVVIKKRGSPLDPQQLERALKLKGSHSMIVVLTHVMGKPYTILCR